MPLTHGEPPMKPFHFPHPKRSSLRHLLCASAFLGLALAPTRLLAAAAPYNSDPNIPYPDVDLSVRSITNAITWLAHTNTDPRLHGKVGPVIPTHAMAVHNTLVWKTNEETPKMLMFHRHSAYTADEMVNPDVINFIVQNPNP